MIAANKEGQNAREVQSSGITVPSIPSMGGGKPYPPDLPGQDEYLVEFDGIDDPTHPQNWSTKIKLVTLSFE
jgi:hypothetical protein